MRTTGSCFNFEHLFPNSFRRQDVAFRAERAPRKNLDTHGGMGYKSSIPAEPGALLNTNLYRFPALPRRVCRKEKPPDHADEVWCHPRRFGALILVMLAMGVHNSSATGVGGG